MLRNRVLTLLAGCLLLGSAALADDLGFVDCSTHPEETEIFAKARKSQDVVGSIPCGERFKIVLYGFIFSEIQTSDGKVGYVYSSILTVDRSGGTLQMRPARDAAPTLSATAEVTKIPAEPKPAPAPAPVKRTAPAAAAATPATTPPANDSASANATVAANAASANSAVAQPANVGNASTDSASASTLPTPAAVLAATDASKTDASAAAAASATTTSASAASASASQTQTAPTDAAPAAGASSAPSATAASATEAASSEAANAAATPTSPAPAAPEAASSASATVAAAAPAAAPEPAPAPAPQPAAPAPAAPARVQPNAPSPKITTESWEKPNPGGKNTSLLEFFGGFAYSRMDAGAGVSNNFLGGVGAFGVNIKPWIQIAGDSSYNFYDVSGVKYVLYGNHYGPRVFLRRHNPLHRFFGVTPFGEALFGGSRQDIHWPASGGNSAYTTSTNGFSWKVGGGLDMRASRLFEIRLIDVDYYRTSFGGVNQSNYWVSTGIVLRLFKGWSD
jgi:hypothetical protein